MPYKDPEEQKKYNKTYLKQHYQDNKQYYADKRDRLRKERQEWLSNYKEGLSCSICGENRIVCLDFHHNDPTKKDEVISRAINKCWSIERLDKEIEKCTILCSNCHRVLHASIV